MSAYCERSDLYSFGLPRGGLANPYRLIADVSAVSDTLTLDQHGLSLNTPVKFRAEAGGTLPAPLVAGTTYYVIPVDDSAFQVSLTEDGAAVDLTTAGDRTGVITPIPFDESIEFGAALIDDALPAHAVPLEGPPYPDIIKMTNAELAVQKLLQLTGRGGDALSKMVDAAQKRVREWHKGKAVRGTNAPTTRTNLATSRAGRSGGWGCGGTLP